MSERTKITIYIDQDLNLDILGELVAEATENLIVAIQEAGGSADQSYSDSNCTQIDRVDSEDGHYTVPAA